MLAIGEKKQISGGINELRLHKFSSHIVTTQPEREANMPRPRQGRTEQVGYLILNKASSQDKSIQEKKVLSQ